MSHSYITMPSPIGKITLIASESHLCSVEFGDIKRNIFSDPIKTSIQEHQVLAQAKSQLDEYFAGKRREFALPLDPQGTPFQKKVWKALRTIPFGKTWSYGDLAKKIGSPKAFRAVGGANNKNPLGIIVPCHRVIGADGSLTGYAGGLDTKKRLIDLEARK